MFARYAMIGQKLASLGSFHLDKMMGEQLVFYTFLHLLMSTYVSFKNLTGKVL